MAEEIKLLPPGKKEEEKGRVPTGVIVGLGAASTAAIGIGLWFLTRRPAEPEPPEPGRANLYGVVIDAQTKKGIPGTMVTLASIVIYTDSSGAYLHEDIMPGSYTVSFDAEGYESKQLIVYLDEGNNKLDVELIPVGLKAEFHCGVWDSVTHEAVVNALVRLDGPETREQRVNQWGDASFYDLMAGDYTITISMTNYQTLQEAISIPPGRTELEFYLVYEPPSGMEGIDVHWIECTASTFVGEEFDVRAQCENVSGAEGDFTIICTINGLTFTQLVHIAYPGWKLVIIPVVVNTPGEYNVCVGGACQPLTVQEAITGIFCCPYCGEDGKDTCVERGGQGRWYDPCLQWEREYFTDLVELRGHMAGHIRVHGLTPIPRCQRAYVYCPICGAKVERLYCPSDRHSDFAQTVLDHIIAQHGEEALYCENVPEGGY